MKSNTERKENYYYWAGSRISHILRNPFYKGAHLVFERTRKRFDPTPMTSFPVRNGKSLKTVMKQSFPRKNGIRFRS